jgi:hypothetical protein
MTFSPILKVGSKWSLIPVRLVVLFNPKYEDCFDRLVEQLRLKTALTSDLVSDVIMHTCLRFPAGKSFRIDQLIEAGAWNDAALVLVELELTAWKLRRLVYEDGAWCCSLTRQPNLSIALDETANASHEVLPLAILSAFIEVHRRMSACCAISSQTVPQARPTSGYAVCCDNFT